MDEREKFYQQRDERILPTRQKGWRDLKEFLTFPACSLSDYLYLRQIKGACLRMKNPLSATDKEQMTDFLIKAVMKDRKMSVDFLETVGGCSLIEAAQKKIDRTRPELSDEFYEKMRQVWDDVCDMRGWRDDKYCQTYFKKKPKEIAIFTENEMYRILKRLPRRQARKLLFLYLRRHEIQKGR